jgi:hypothetical protein
MRYLGGMRLRKFYFPTKFELTSRAYHQGNTGELEREELLQELFFPFTPWLQPGDPGGFIGWFAQ